MATITTYTNLQTTITEYLARDQDATLIARIPTFIQLAEAKFNRNLFVRQMEQRSTTAADTGSSEPEFISLPTDFQSMRRVRLSGITGKPLLELDQEIERTAGAALSEIFLMYGQAGYRRYELNTLQQIIHDHPACVIATGGSIVSAAETYVLLRANCYTVWLKTTPEEHMARVIAQGDFRPMTGQPEAMDDLRRILSERAHGYSQADVIVDTAGLTIEAAIAALIHALDRRIEILPGVSL